MHVHPTPGRLGPRPLLKRILLPALVAAATVLVAIVPAMAADAPARLAVRGDSAGSPKPNSPALLSSWAPAIPSWVDYTKTRYEPYGQFVSGTSGFVVNDETWGPEHLWPSAGYGNGFDFLHLENAGPLRTATTNDLWDITLNRAATVVLVWRPNQVPAWIKNAGFVASPVAGDWYCGGQCSTYTRVTTGPTTIALGGPSVAGETQDMYYVLLGEANGKPTPAPSQLGSPAAAPNQPCPQWVHDQYMTTAPDGKRYPTWHAPIDPVYWCSFGHEHGSDPRLFSPTFQPAYGYADALDQMSEDHRGFKSYHVTVGNQDWYFTQHFQSASVAGACNSMHEVQIAEHDVGSSQLNANLQYVGNFGVAQANVGGARLTPPSCPNQGVGNTSEGRRLFVVQSDPGGPTFYEPWRMDNTGGVLGIAGAITFNTLDPGVMCDTINCQMVPTGLTGTHRYAQTNRGFGLIAGAQNRGTFYTDAMASRFVASGAPGAVKQYLAPGLNLVWPYANDNFFLDNTSGDCFVHDYQYVDIHLTGGHTCNVEGTINSSGPGN
jgi:hypothetical protein